MNFFARNNLLGELPIDGHAQVSGSGSLTTIQFADEHRAIIAGLYTSLIDRTLELCDDSEYDALNNVCSLMLLDLYDISP